jgi:SAM-dependent methyltransferase
VTDTKIQIDLGCGTAKRPGHVGLDMYEMPGVDYVLDLTSEPFPFEDDSVDGVFSSHFLEHIEEPNHVFSEIGRVCRDGARIEFWTPYAWTNDAFLYGHLHSITEEMWNQICLSHRDAYVPMVGGRWVLRRFVYVIQQPILDDLRGRDIDLDFALRYYKGVVHEMGVELEYRSDLDAPVLVPERMYATERFGPRVPVSATVPSIRDEARALVSTTAARSRALTSRVVRAARRRIGAT